MATIEKKTGLTVLTGITALMLCAGLVQAATGYGVSNIFTIDNREGEGPFVTGISSQYTNNSKASYFLAGVSLNQEFTATIDWADKTPSQVKWYRNSTLIATDNISGGAINRTFNVGTNFAIGERLFVQAIADDGTSSAKMAANFNVIPAPPGLGSILFFQDEWLSGAQNAKYKSFPFNIGFPKIQKDQPWLDDKNKLYEIAQVSWKSIIEVTAEVDLNGYAEIKAGSGYVQLKKSDFILSGIDIGGKLKVVMTFDYSNNDWKFGGGFDLSGSGNFTAKPTYVVFMVGPVPVPTYYRFAVDSSVSAKCRFTDGTANNPIFSGNIPVTGGLEGMAGVGIADFFACEGYLKGGLNFNFQLPQQPYLKDWYLSLNGGIRIVLVLYKYENNLLSYRWPQEEAMTPLIAKAMTVENLEPMSRDYLANDYAQWNDGGSMMKAMGIQAMGSGGTETTLQTNIFGQSNAVLAVSGGTKCLIWLYDEPTRNSLDRTMLVYSINSGSGWSVPAVIDDDGTADAMPALSVDSSGNFICVWANASQLIPDGTLLNAFADKLDIKMAVYDNISGTWTSETLTNAAASDYNPKVVCDSSGNITVVWTHDSNNDLLSENPPVANTLMARTKTSGSGWQTEQSLAVNSGFIKFTDIKADFLGTSVVYCLDTDSDMETDADNELYYTNQVAGSWSGVSRLTNDTYADVNPQLIPTASGLMLIWARDGKIVSTTDIAGMTGIADVIAQDGSSGQRGFVSSISLTGNISVVWNDPSAAGSDLYMSTFDPTMEAWSDVIQITDNRDMERSISAVYSNGSTFEMAYNKVHITDANGLNAFGQVDLCVYAYPIGSDVVIIADSIKLTDPNAVPGDTTNLQATIANIGDIAVADIPVAFYCGSTAIPSNQIGQTQMVSGNLAAGTEAIVSVNWTIPVSTEPLNIIIIADPNLQIEDKDRQNNSSSVTMFGANLSIQNVHVDSDINGTFYVSAGIANTGFIPVQSGIAVKLTSAENLNTTIDSQSIASLDPKQSGTTVLTIHSDDMVYGFNEFKLAVDPNNVVAETSENDNLQNVLVRNTVAYDLIVDGAIDILDLDVLAQQWLNATGGLTADIAPYGGDGEVNMTDFIEIAKYWLKDYTL